MPLPLIPIISALLPTISKVIDKVVPDKGAAALAKADMEKALVEAASQGALAQIEVNKVEAAHRSIFVAGWRPSIGWICSLALFWTYLGTPILQSILAVKGIEVELVSVDMDYLLELIFGMLGLGGLRTWEKSRGLTK